MTDTNTEPKKRKMKWATFYSNMTIAQAEKRLGFKLEYTKAVSVDRMLANAKYSLGGEWADAILKTKEKVYDGIVGHVMIEGYPTEANPDFKEANISDLVYITLHPILCDFISKTGRNLRLSREKEIVSTDGETGGTEEFVLVDVVSVTESKFIFIVEAKRSSLGQATKQCLLAMKDMRDNNGDVGEVYGFITTGESWRMLSYDGTFQMTNKMDVLFDTMGEEKEKWMKGYSDIVDCMYVALSNGGK